MKRRADEADGRVTDAKQAAEDAHGDAVAAESSYNNTVAELNALIDEYGGSLPEPQYSQAKALEEEAKALSAEYEDAVASYNEQFDVAKEAVNAYNRRVRVLNSAVRKVDRQLSQHETNYDAYEDRLFGCLVAAQSWDESTKALEERLAAPVAEVAGVSQAAVECDDTSTWRTAEAESDPKYQLAGYVVDGETTMHLSPVLCYELDRIIVQGERPDLDCLATLRLKAPLCRARTNTVANGLVTLAHETQHISGITQEAKAECYGLQATPELGQSFGFTEEEARRLARFMTRTSSKPPEYRSRECRNGGVLDQHPDSPVWP